MNEMVPHVPTTATCLNALSVPMLRQVLTSKKDLSLTRTPAQGAGGFVGCRVCGIWVMASVPH